jgi:hypothetical protein
MWYQSQPLCQFIQLLVLGNSLLVELYKFYVHKFTPVLFISRIVFAILHVSKLFKKNMNTVKHESYTILCTETQLVLS